MVFVAVPGDILVVVFDDFENLFGVVVTDCVRCARFFNANWLLWFWLVEIELVFNYSELVLLEFVRARLEVDLRVAMPVFCSQPPQQMRSFSTCTMIWFIFRNFTRTAKASACSPRTLVLELKKSRHSMELSWRQQTSNHSPWDSLKSWQRTSVLCSSKRSHRSTPNSTLKSTKKRRSPSFPLLSFRLTSRARSSMPSRLTHRMMEKSSQSTTKLMIQSWADFKCTPSLNSWICHLLPVCQELTRRSRRRACERKCEKDRANHPCYVWPLSCYLKIIKWTLWTLFL